MCEQDDKQEGVGGTVDGTQLCHRQRGNLINTFFLCVCVLFVFGPGNVMCGM